MIGAMPAVAVRQERQKQSQQKVGTSRDTLTSNGVSTQHTRRSSRPVRPNHLALQTRTSSLDSSVGTPGSLTLVPLTVPSTGSTPLASIAVTTPRQMREPLTAEQMATDYCCHGKFPLLHVIVVSLLIGITLLIVGLVQLKPNADSEAKKYFFLGTAGACCATGLFLMSVRCMLRYRFRRESMLIPRRLIERDDSSFSFCGRAEERDRAASSPADSIALLPQRF